MPLCGHRSLYKTHFFTKGVEDKEVIADSINYLYMFFDTVFMMMIARNKEYSDILNAVRGKKVAVWTCNTCAKLCNGMGGMEAAYTLAESLRADGVDVKSLGSVSAGCLMSKVMPKANEMRDSADVVISLTCDVGVTCAIKAFRKDVLAPFVTLGLGYADENGNMTIISGIGVHAPVNLEEFAKGKGMVVKPLI